MYQETAISTFDDHDEIVEQITYRKSGQDTIKLENTYQDGLLIKQMTIHGDTWIRYHFYDYEMYDVVSVLYERPIPKIIEIDKIFNLKS